MLYYENRLRRQGYHPIIGIDEAGRGPLAGPVVAAAVAFDPCRRFVNRIDDSKRLTPRQRESAFQEISAKAVFGLGIADEKVIEALNILQATILAMKAAAEDLLHKLKGNDLNSVYALVDGNMRLDLGIPYLSIIQGDARSQTIACASIIAKVSRDRMMDDYDVLYPEYGFRRHKGYPTTAHRQVLRKIGPCPIHRKTFHYA